MPDSATPIAGLLSQLSLDGKPALDYSAYPHIVERIFSFASWDTLLTLRLVSRRTLAQADAVIFFHFTITWCPERKYMYPSCGLAGAGGPLPGDIEYSSSMWLKRITHVEVVDIIEAEEIKGTQLPFTLWQFFKWASKAHRLRLVRRTRQVGDDLALAPTIVDVADMTRKKWGSDVPAMFLEAWGKRTEKHVVVVLCDGGLRPYLSIPNTQEDKWIVFIFRKGPTEATPEPHQPTTFRASFAAEFVTLAVFHKHVKFTFVGLCDLDDEMLGVPRTEVHQVAAALAQTLPPNEELHLDKPAPSCPIEERLEFLSNDQYAAAVGAETWDLERWDEVTAPR